ncbi:MAG: putative sulfate exporter family transporter [Tidjanibacter sp.]|nr:putative sulfate exporter family transporter [Tidjanibacter sp.]MBQ3070088.1 putative sulfate exporter family transporter [Tidjanibacter sp.]MBR3932107.1 putative sulfate exporter family transporter [Tidjanibacter sp.]
MSSNKTSKERMMYTLRTMTYWLCAIGSLWVSPAVALFMGIVLALTIGAPYGTYNKKVSKVLLQASVVGLGFGMNLHASLAAGREGMLFTIVSVVGVMLLGVLLGRVLKVNPKNAYLISSGTAICGGSAIAAVAPIIDADDNDTSLALATIFILNAVALFVFPPIGHALGLSEQQFGTWAAIAIHDTSSVVGAGAAYGEEALAVATTIKLTRALWIFPLALVSVLVFRSKGKRVAIPWFILMFIVAMVCNTYLPLPEWLTGGIVKVARKALCLTLFLIGCGLSVGAIRKVGAKPLVLGVVLWTIISLTTLAVVMI